MEENHLSQEENKPLGYTPYTSPQKSASRLLFKMLCVGGIFIALLIPLLLITNVVDERQSLAYDVEDEISQKWGGSQNVIAPILMVPYEPIQKPKDWNEAEDLEYERVLPINIHAEAQLDAQVRKRSIYTVPVYTADVKMSGEWNLDRLPKLPEDKKYLFEKAQIIVCYGYRNGVEYPQIKVGQDSLQVLHPDRAMRFSFSDYESGTYSSPLMLNYPMDEASFKGTLPFSLPIKLRGAKEFYITPLSDEAHVSIQSNWQDPSFNGDLLPEDYTVGQSGFDASWNVLGLSSGEVKEARAYDIENVVISSTEDIAVSNTEVDLSEFSNIGVKLYEPLNNYVLTSRSIKYGILVIFLTLLSIFFTELIFRKKNISINLFHYLLSGLALVIFFLLLLSFSEIIGFGWAYLIAALMVVGLNALYFKLLLKEWNPTLTLTGIMAFLYLATYLLMMMETYALLVGSLGLFVLLMLIMFLSAKFVK